MIAIIVYSVVFTALNIVLSSYLNVNILLLLDVFVWVVLNVWLSRIISTRSNL